MQIFKNLHQSKLNFYFHFPHPFQRSLCTYHTPINIHECVMKLGNLLGIRKLSPAPYHPWETWNPIANKVFLLDFHSDLIKAARVLHEESIRSCLETFSPHNEVDLENKRCARPGRSGCVWVECGWLGKEGRESGGKLGRKPQHLRVSKRNFQLSPQKQGFGWYSWKGKRSWSERAGLRALRTHLGRRRAEFQ